MARDYKNIARKALRKATDKNVLNEGFGYPEGMMERIHPTIEKNIIERKTAIGDHPALPKGGVRGFDQKLLLGRFIEVVNRYKEAFGVDQIDDDQVNAQTQQLLMDCMMTESKHKKELIDLAIEMVREEFDMSEDAVDIEADIVDRISLKPNLDRETSDEEFEFEYDDHDHIDSAEGEVMKRRLINALIQGAAMKTNHMFNLVNDQLVEINPTLPSKYKKLMSAADYSYFKNLAPTGQSQAGGVCNVDTSDEEGKPKILAEAVTFPVLIHELVKGVMELISLHGFSEDERLNEFVISQADFTGAEPSDMRMGPALWGLLTGAISPEDQRLKHHVYHRLVSKPVDEFNDCMREIFAGTSKGKKLVSELCEDIKSDLSLDEMLEVDEGGESIDDIQASQNHLRDLLNRDDFDDILGSMMG